MKTRGFHVRPYKAKWGHWGPVSGPYRTKGGHRDLFMSPKGFHRAPISDPRESYGDEQSYFFLIFCEILFCFVLTFSFITFSILTQIQRSWSFSNRERNGHQEKIRYF